MLTNTVVQFQRKQGGSHLQQDFIENDLGSLDQFRSHFDEIVRPRHASSFTEPSTANTSRPCSRTSFAVMSDPPFVALH